MPNPTPVLKPLGKHLNGPVPQGLNGCFQYNKLKYGKTWSISVFQNNNTIMLSDSTICVIQNIIYRNGNYELVVKRFNQKQNFYESIAASSTCGVYHCSSLNEQIDVVSLNEMIAKCFWMPYWLNAPTVNCVANHFVVVKISSTSTN